MDLNLINFHEASDLIEEGDVLLFRGVGFISKWIRWAGKSKYTHVALASWRGTPHQSLLEATQFREWRGGLTISLEKMLIDYPNSIDVYRPSTTAFIFGLSEVEGKSIVTKEVVKYDGRAATDTLRALTGTPYGWRRIGLLSLQFIPGIRFFVTPCFEDKAENGGLYPVCSTAVAAAIRRNFVDLMPNLSDFEMEPGHVANSALLHYLFTIAN